MVFLTTTPSDSTVNGFFTVPTSAETGPTRFRVAMGDVINGPCDDIANGEVQDYTIIISTPYCGDVSASTSNSWLQEFCVNATCVASGNNGGYRMVHTAQTLIAGTTFNITLIPAYSGAKVPVYWKIYLDGNRDGDFDDAFEMIFDGGAADTAVVNGQFTIPASTLNGGTRIRFMMSEAPIAAACNAVVGGEIEDFGIQIIGGQFTRLGDLETVETPTVHFSDPLAITLMPNPVTQVAYLNIAQVSDSPVFVTVMDMNGKVVFVEKIDGVSGYALNTSEWNNGVYHITVQSATAIAAVRMVVAK